MSKAKLSALLAAIRHATPCAPLRRLRRPARAVAASLLVITLCAPPASAQCNTTLDVTSVDEKYFSFSDLLSSIQTNPLILPTPALLSQGVGLIESLQNGCGTLSLYGLSITGEGVDIEIETALPAVGSAAADFEQNGVTLNNVKQNLRDNLSITPCDPRPYARLTHTGGEINAYAFHVGVGPYVRKIRKATYKTCRDLVVQNGSNEPIELPVSVSGSIFAAESFGDNTRNYGRARMRMWGTIDGREFSRNIPADGNFLESVTVLPEEDSATVTRRLSLVPSGGQYNIRIVLNAEAETQVQAKSLGLYGAIAGSATAGVSFPTSFDILNFTGADGKPLPPGVLIYDSSDGSIYADTRAFPGAPDFLITATLRRDAQTGEVVADVTVTNAGPGEARGVQLTGATLNGAPTTTPAQTIGRLIPLLPAGRATRALRFPAGGGAGTGALLKVQGQYQGGKFGGDIQVTLP